MTTLIVICAWCRRYLGTKDGKGKTGISHAICPKCKTKQFQEAKKK